MTTTAEPRPSTGSSAPWERLASGTRVKIASWRGNVYEITFLGCTGTGVVFRSDQGKLVQSQRDRLNWGSLEELEAGLREKGYAELVQQLMSGKLSPRAWALCFLGTRPRSSPRATPRNSRHVFVK